MIPSARLKSAGLAPGCAGAIVPDHALLAAPPGPGTGCSLPIMKPGKNGFPLLTGPP
jgi:hypothetical protein